MNKKWISSSLVLALCLNLGSLPAAATDMSSHALPEDLYAQSYEQRAESHLTENEIQEVVSYTKGLVTELSQQDKVKIMIRLTPDRLPSTYDRKLLDPEWQMNNGPYALSFKNLSMLVEELLPGMLRCSTPLGMGDGGVVQDYKDMIELNKENFFAGLIYVDRLYNFTMNGTNIRDALLTMPDRYVPESPYDPLSLLMDIGGKGVSRYDSTKPSGVLTLDKSAKNFNQIFQNYNGYNVLNIGTLPEFLEKSQQLFMPDKTLDEWFPTAGNAYIVERYFSSGNPGRENTSLYDKLTNSGIIAQSRILPLLTVPKDSIYVISTPSSVTYGLVGAYGERDEALMQKINQAADEQIAYLDFWNRMIPDERKGKMVCNNEVYDSISRYDPNNSSVKERWLEQTDSMSGMQDFVIPLMMYDKFMFSDAQASENSAGGVGTIRFWLVRVLEDRGSSTFGHELTHILEDDAWMGQPRRDGMGGESYTRGMFETYDERNVPVLNLNLLYENRDEGLYYRNKSPQRFQTADDLKTYMNGVMDVVNTLDYAEAEVALQWTPAQKVKWFHKFQQQEVSDKPYCLDEIVTLNEQEAAQLTTVHDLVDHDIVAARYGINGYKTVGRRDHNSYDVVPLFTANYMAAQNDNGISGDIMVRRHAHDLLAEYGYYEGMVPYISNQYKGQAEQEGRTFSDGYILEQVSQGQYKQMKQFKKDMLDRRYEKRDQLKPVTIQWEGEAVTVQTYDQMKNLLATAMEKDLLRSDCGTEQPGIRSHETNVEKLKAAIMAGYLEQTDEFRLSIYNDAEVIPPALEPQNITVKDVDTIYGATGVKVEASTDGDGALTYAVTSGDDVVSVDPSTGVLTIKKAGNATVTVTAAETSTHQKASKTLSVTVAKKYHAPVEKSIQHQAGTIGQQSFALSNILPNDAGALTYTVGQKTDSAGLVSDSWTVQENSLVYVLSGIGKDGDTAELRLVISSENYEDTELLVRISLFGTQPTQPKPTEPKPTQPKPTEPKPTEPKPTQPKPTEPKPTEPKPTQPKPTQPKPTEPKPTEPKPTQPKPTQPKPTEPKPTQPKPTEPKPTQPKPTEPKPTEPKPTVPKPTAPVTYTVSFQSNGGSKIAAVSGSKGTTVNLSKYVPTRSGFDFAGWYSDAKLTNRVTSVILSQNLTVYAKWTKKIVKNPFLDVSSDKYYYKPVLWAVSNQITAGVSETSFAPNQNCTRGQIVTFLWSAAGKPKPKTTKNPFADVNRNDYFYNAVLWAVENGITSGVAPNRFAPNQTCTRAQAVTFLWSASGKPNVPNGTTFRDVNTSDYYYRAVQWAVANGVTAGIGGGRFGPNQTCTRAQIVTFLYKVYG